MQSNLRPRRSVLYLPGANPRALEKARGLPADALIFDLEDAVAADAKADARSIVAAALEQGGYGARELILRVNALSTPWGEDDLALAATLPIHGVLLPKVESADDVRAAQAVYDATGAERTLDIWCMIETPLGVLRAGEIAAAGGRLAGFVMGTNDLVKDLGARHTANRLPIVTALSLAILAARAHGLAIIDGVHIDLDDDAGFETACRQGVELGFDGKTLIHPRTIDAANRIFAPSADDIAAAHRMIAGFEAAKAEGKGVARIDGKLVEQLHVDSARRLLDMVAAIERLAE
jgi:citrate lyase subunit beta/citryl-CoA lyase